MFRFLGHFLLCRRSPLFIFLLKFWFLWKISIFEQNVDFWPTFWPLTTFLFLTKFRFLTKISVFDQNFDSWSKFRLSTKISVFGQNFGFRPKIRYLAKISVFGQILHRSPAPPKKRRRTFYFSKIFNCFEF